MKKQKIKNYNIYTRPHRESLPTQISKKIQLNNDGSTKRNEIKKIYKHSRQRDKIDSSNISDRRKFINHRKNQPSKSHWTHRN